VKRAPLEFRTRKKQRVTITAHAMTPLELTQENREYPLRFASQYARKEPFLLAFVIHSWFSQGQQYQNADEFVDRCCYAWSRTAARRTFATRTASTGSGGSESRTAAWCRSPHLVSSTRRKKATCGSRSTIHGRLPCSQGCGRTGPRCEKKEGETTNDVFAFLTTEPNDVVGAIHQKAMPVILTKPDEIERWMTGPPEEALILQRPLPDGALRIVARGTKEIVPIQGDTGSG
jgi:hypothetical protein